MENFDRYHPTEINDYDSANGNELDRLKSVDRGYSFVYRNVIRKDGEIKRTKIGIYTSGDFGSTIRDAVTGHYYTEKVGSYGEHLFFKVGLSTGECKPKNGNTTLFFLSPEQYEKHLSTTVSEEVKNEWNNKRDSYVSSNKKSKK
jgi:hypothetical protein